MTEEEKKLFRCSMLSSAYYTLECALPGEDLSALKASMDSASKDIEPFAKDGVFEFPADVAREVDKAFFTLCSEFAVKIGRYVEAPYLPIARQGLELKDLEKMCAHAQLVPGRAAVRIYYGDKPTPELEQVLLKAGVTPNW